MTGAVSFELQAASVDFGQGPALRGVDLKVEAGEAVAFVGSSGAGKTTLLRLLTGDLRPTGGRISVGGRWLDTLSPWELRALRARVGFVHQDLALVPNLRVIRNVIAGGLGRMSLTRSLRAMLLPPRALVLEAHRILERVGIGDVLFQRTDRLSGGQQQRVAVARALFQEPAALLADEPVSSVDPARARDVIALLHSISRERGLTLCASLHDVELAREFFPRLVGLRHGRLVFDRPAERLPQSTFDELYDLEPDPARVTGAPHA